ncbi:hypothetical protein Ddye_013931 [Dipteronia dyeriana]|uniref:NusG-like N-terminal domain-containing protein n=1 Tax=Dipteronia dyeriana TaxID=168575 RepID=A0AAD9X751_9ROSI|nr:hypothetical protein Ddye_013931 [Dipteronia dyeriana]
MPHRRDDEEDIEDDDYEDQYNEEVEEDDLSSRKRRRSEFIDDVVEEEDYGGGGCGAQVDSDEDEEEEEAEDDFIVDGGANIPDEDDGRRMHRHPLLSRKDEQEDVEALERRIQARYARSNTANVEQQAILPSIRDPKLWMVKCAIGREREATVCLMQKCIDGGPELQIRSAVALDHLNNYIYVEADKEAHVREACKGMRNIYSQKVMFVPIRDMTDVLSVENKAIDLSRDIWVRMKIDNYNGDLAKVVDVDNVRRRVTVKLILRIDLQALAIKLEGRGVSKKKFVPPPHFMNVDEARELHIRVERRRDQMTGDYFENIGGMLFKDGFMYKTKGATRMVVKVDQHVLIILSDTMKEHIRVFVDDVVECSKVTNGITKIGDYELHDLVLLDNNSFGVVICVESEAFQVLKGVPDRPEAFVHNHDSHHQELTYPTTRNGDAYSRFDCLRSPPSIPQSPWRFSRGGPLIDYGGRQRDGRGNPYALIGATVKIHQGPEKGCMGRVLEVKGQSVRVELEARMKVVTVDRSIIFNNVEVSTPYRDAPRYGMGSETPMHPSRTPLHSYMTPMRDAGVIPIHNGIRTPMHDRAWNPYTPISPPRDNWEDGNPASWGTSPQYQPGSPFSRPYEAPTPGSG